MGVLPLDGSGAIPIIVTQQSAQAGFTLDDADILGGEVAIKHPVSNVPALVRAMEMEIMMAAIPRQYPIKLSKPKD